jgi:2-polyprenyl-3-methyl-5-hydroxy-6-metoxy-1,4-benzoquinol methylase
MLKDTSYALVRRLFFVENAIREHLGERGNSPVVVADIGCGTGELLTIPLSENLGNSVVIYAYEPESGTFQSLKNRIDELGIQNILPIHDKESLQILTYDVIIVSEVIEHVEDPIDFLDELKQLLKAHGIMIITTPNGFGIFEIETMLFNTLDLIGIIPVLRKIKRKVFRTRNNSIPLSNADSLAISPHINFFTLSDLYQIILGAGLSLKKIEGKHLTAGPFSDRIIDKSEKLIKLNAYLGEILPLELTAGWMLITEKAKCRLARIKYYELKKRANLFRKIYSRYKRWLNIHLAYSLGKK